jgi:hypothetical protein
MRKSIRRVLPKDEHKYQRDYWAKVRYPKERPTREQTDRVVSADRILGNQAIVQLLSLKLQTEGEEATINFLESLGCSDIGKVMKMVACQ